METMDLALRTYFVPDELEALLKFIPSTQLLKFRQVSKELEEVAQLVLRKRRDIKLHLTTDNFDSRTDCEFLQFLNDSPENVFVAPVIHIENINKSDQDLKEGKICVQFPIIREICERLGNRGIIKELIIEDGEFAPHFTSDFVFALLLSHSSTLETVWFYGLQLSAGKTSEQSPKFQLPCLKQIDFGYANNNCDVKEARNLLNIIFSSSPKLENISFSECEDKIRELRDLDLISLLRDTKHLSKMKEIILTKSADLDILLQCKPKIELQCLEIETEDKDIVNSKKLFAFLQQQADNLKSFRCDGNSLIPKSILTLPLLPVLKELSFEPWESGCLLSANYGRQTPALKALMIVARDSSYQSWEEFLFYEVTSEMPPCLSLEYICLFIEGEVVPTLTYQKALGNWKQLFPNVKKLSFGRAEQFDMEQLSKCWPKLETLKLQLLSKLEGNDLDELLFGISPDWKEGIDKTEEKWWIKVPAPEIKGTVANLKSLKELKVKLFNFGDDVTLTDFAVYFGLRQMQNLTKLKITSNHEEMEVLSTKAFDFLLKNLPKLEKLQVLGKKWERGEILE